MSERYSCDVCYEEIECGHVVEHAYVEEFPRAGVVRTVEGYKRRHVCDDCWPGDTDKSGVLKQLLETVGLVE